MKKEQVFREFNEKGIFPSDAVLNEIAKSHPNEYDDAYDVDMEMIMIAFNDANHPYHSKVNGKVTTPVFTISIEDLSKEQVFREFNEKGIFPSDAVLNEIAKSHPNEYDDAFDVEHEMIMIAFNDANHPYHLTRVYPYHHLMRVNNPPVFTINTKDLSITEEMPHKAPMDSHKMGPSYTD